MNLFEKYLIGIIFILFRCLVYLFYIAYNKNSSKKVNKIFFELAVFSSFYLILKYGLALNNVLILIFNIPLLIAFYYNKRIESIIISIILIFYYNYYFDYNIIILLIAYFSYYVEFIIIGKKSNPFVFVNIFNITSIIIFMLIIKDTFINYIFQIILYYLSSLLIIYLIDKGESIIKYHMDFKKLKESEQIRTSLFKITHEIKNPIAVCKGYIDMFDVNNKSHAEKYISIIKNEINKTLLILQDFLSISKINIKKDILDINLLITDVLNSLESFLKEKEIKIDFKENDEEIYISADYDRMSQVLTNIIKNSIEAIEKKGIIEIEIKDNKNNLEIIIKDNGQGIEDITKIKEPFYTTKKMGTGLGVYLSSEIIKAHKGSILYEPLENGTKVLIKLPK